MPVVLRICVAIEKALLQPPPTSILLNSSLTSKQAATVAVAGDLPPTPMSSMTVAHTKPEPTKPAATSTEPTQTGVGEDTTPPSRAKSQKKAEGNAGDKNASKAPPPPHRHHSPFHWFKRRHKPTKKKTTSTDTSAAKSTTPASTSKAVPHASTTAPETAKDSTKGRHPTLQLPIADAASRPPHPLTSHEPATASERPTAVDDSRKGEDNEEEIKKGVEPRRSLVWVSVQLTESTTVKSIVQKVQDMVERRMGARLCEDHNYFQIFSTSAASAGFFAGAAAASQGTAAKSDNRCGDSSSASRGADGGGESDNAAAASPSVHIISSALKNGLSTLPQTTEWCLCLQDSDGVFHWIGGTRHYQKMAVLRAPFIAEVCLQSHAAFEAERRRQKDEMRAQRSVQRKPSATGSSVRMSFATSGGLSALEDADSVSLHESTGTNESSLLTSAEDDREERSNADDDAAGRGGGRRRHLSLHRHHANTNDTKVTAGKPSRAKKKKSGGKSGGKLTEPPRSPDMTAPKFSATSKDEVKLAFLKGVMMPSFVLRQYNPRLTRHHCKTYLYNEVHVPHEMRADPLDPVNTTIIPTTPLSTVTQPAPEEPRAHAVPAPAAESSSSRAAIASFESPKVQTPNFTEEDVDVDVNTNVPPSADAPLSSPSSTLLNRSPPQEGDTDILQMTQRPVKTTDDDNSAPPAPPAAAAGVHAGLPIALATHATALEGLCSDGRDDGQGCLSASEKKMWCRTADAAHVKKVDVGLLKRLTDVEDVARIGLAKAQSDYETALLAYRAAVPPTPTKIHQQLNTEEVNKEEPTNESADAEYIALLRRKIELQASVEERRTAERQCARLTAFVECLERELRECDERCAFLQARQGELCE